MLFQLLIRVFGTANVLILFAAIAIAGYLTFRLFKNSARGLMALVGVIGLFFFVFTAKEAVKMNGLGDNLAEGICNYISQEIDEAVGNNLNMSSWLDEV